ncbi:hypothetical protein F2Q68_00023219 [Brassica cretica]|uniref:RNase H type-1 domain-containing protein n=1 Tax=Brassica cretica TaxID=69181 RepID=A0A8S9FSX1_BRACR|nr:hypothetical protein F2Q68_00023219 [Brassica cretica]
MKLINSPLIAEALALRSALLSAEALGLSKLRCYSDNATLIRAINTDTQIKEIYGIIQDIKLISSAFVAISFNHFARSLNVKADYKEQHHIPHGKESVQEKKILSQENKIQRLNDQVQDLRRQLVQCRNENLVEGLLAGLGWTIKNSRETQRFSSSTDFVMSPLMAEGFAMREAIKKSKELGIRQLRCESDSSQLIKALNSSTEPLEIYGIISDILE